ncbi:MAG: RDD family protein [Chloroflexi bacterium]|nr:RDD family protein [Chloroflexota bacterium]
MEQAIGSLYQPQGVLKRFVALVLDAIVLLGLGYLLALATGGTSDAGFNLTDGPALLWFGLGFVYFTGFEGLYGATPGKIALGLKVVREDGSPIGLREALIRNLLRLVDGMFGFLVGAILIWGSDRKQRLGDRVAGTLVVGR